MANAWNINVIVINKQVDGGHNMHIVSPSTSTQITGDINLYKLWVHHDACLPNSSARIELAVKSSLNHVPLAEKSADETVVKAGRHQSN